jgi:hypothetical protein
MVLSVADEAKGHIASALLAAVHEKLAIVLIPRIIRRRAYIQGGLVAILGPRLCHGRIGE